MLYDIYGIAVVMKIETDIIASIAVRLIELAEILVMMYVETFKTVVIVLSVTP